MGNLSLTDKRELLENDFLDDGSWNEDAVENEVKQTEYDFGAADVGGFDLNLMLATDPLTKKSQKWSAEEKRRKMAEYRDIRIDPNASKVAKDRAYYNALCLLYPYCRSLLHKFCVGHFGVAMSPEDYMQQVFIVVASELEHYDTKYSIFQYFQLRIKHELIVQVAQSQSVTRYYNEQLTKIKRVYADLAQNGKVPTVADVAYILPDISVKTIKKCLDIIDASQISYDYAELTVPSRSNPEDDYLKDENAQYVRDAIKRVLPADEFEVLCYSYGIGSYPELSREATANCMGISIDQVRKLKLNAEKRLRRELKNNGFTDTTERATRNMDKIRSADIITFLPLMSDEDMSWLEDDEFGNGFQA